MKKNIVVNIVVYLEVILIAEIARKRFRRNDMSILIQEQNIKAHSKRAYFLLCVLDCYDRLNSHSFISSLKKIKSVQQTVTKIATSSIMDSNWLKSLSDSMQQKKSPIQKDGAFKSFNQKEQSNYLNIG